MEGKARFLGHPVHPMLIVFPLGLLATAMVFDILALSQKDPMWFHLSFWMIAAGLVGGLCAALFGFIDWIAIPGGTRAARIGLYHGGTYLVVVLLFAASWYARRESAEIPSNSALVLSFLGAACALVGGWLGGELVHRLGVGVDEGANLNAPNSMLGRVPVTSSTKTATEYPMRKAS